MVGCRYQADFSKPKCSFYFFILGLIVAYFTTHSSHVQAASCRSKNISYIYRHCGIHPDGVHSLDCFGKHSSRGMKTCVWKPGNHTSQKTYTLIIQQQSKKYCRAYNISDPSTRIPVYHQHHMTAEVFENSHSTNCTKAVFSGSPNSFLRCGAPYNVSFRRHAGMLDVNVSWQQDDMKLIKYYSVRYKVLGSLFWSKVLEIVSDVCVIDFLSCAQSPVRSQNEAKCTVENLNPSLVYSVQIQCVTSDQCSQCVWSEAFTVPAELTAQPAIVSLDYTDSAERKGRRLLSLTWKFSAKQLYDGYHVTIWKASGEAPRERLNTTQPEIRLILSYSAYHLNISAVNNVSTSPAVSQTIPLREDASAGTGAGNLNVTVNNNTSFTIYWKDNLIKNYVCYSVEWMKKGHKAVHMSFHQNKNNYRTLSGLPEPLEPYKRYSITLHTRPNKETCNMKHINNSESTYGTTQFYFIEGSPVSAPTNISSCNVTLDSVVLRWSSIPEEDIRGFLLGYIIHYTEYKYRETSTTRNITVDPVLTSYELRDLKSGTTYEVEISGFTQAGAGVRSPESIFKTNYEGYSNLVGVITAFAVVATVLTFGPPIIKRAKVILWPSIPNPRHSNAMQKTEGPCELELLESINTLKVEEWDTNSLLIIEKENVIPAATLPSLLPLLHASEDEGDSAEMTSDLIHSDTEDSSGDIRPDITAETSCKVQRADSQSSPFAFASGYTTMEMFHSQAVLAITSVTQAVESKPEDADLTVAKSGLDYLGQFSTSPILDNKEMSTIL